jgi:putative ABC transport system permease protein
MTRANVLSALRALRTNKLRGGLTIIGVVIGVAAVITGVAIGAGAQALVAEQIRSLGSNLLLVTAGSLNAGGVRSGAGTRVSLTDDDAQALQHEIAAVQAAAPTLGRRMQVVHGNLNWATVVTGVTPEWFEVKEWQVLDGRAITAQDYDSAAKVALVGQTVAQRLYGEHNPLGTTIRIGRVPFTVVGVLQPKGQNTEGRDQDDLLMVPLSTARQKLFGAVPGKARAVWVITVKIREGEDFAQAETAIRDLLRQRHGLGWDQDDDFTIRRQADVVRGREEASEVLAYLLAAIAAVSLLVGGIGIMNVMLVSVTERTREIGLRLAVGARRRDILVQFLMEAVILSLIGGAIGVAMGLGSALLLGHVAEWRVEVVPEVVVVAFGFAGLVGVLFGTYPALKAAALDPIEALRWE